MKVSDYIVQYITQRGTNCAFGYPGGMVTYLIDSFDNNPNIDALSLYHEQAAAFAACGYAQSSGNVGVAYATSGPGATNLITGICHAYYESVPTLFITGQVNTKESKGALKIRQKGFQETDVVNMIGSVTKYSAYIKSAEEIKYHLDKAFYFATEGRPGPVLLDIPIDIQRTEVDTESLVGFNPPNALVINYESLVKIITSYLQESKKPVIILGNGVNVSGVSHKIRRLLERLKIPVVTSMTAIDILSSDNEYNFGFIGTYGNRYANFIISQSDTIISLGSRLDIRQTGANIKEFAKKAKLIRIDIDSIEFENKIRDDEIDIHADLKDLVNYMLVDEELLNYSVPKKWLNQCAYYKNSLAGIDITTPNKIVKTISDYLPSGATITTDVGQNQVWISQSFNIKSGQRVLFSGGHGSMGYSLPAAIGAYYDSKEPIYCFTGDGGLQINIQELQYLVRENIPIKIFILNNHSLGMIRHFQEMYFESNFAHTVANRGYSCPNFEKIGVAYGIRSYSINNITEIENHKNELMDENPVLFNINVGDITFVYPKLEFTKPIYDQEPALDRGLLDELLYYEG